MPDDGLYIHRRSDQMPEGTRTMTVEVDGKRHEWVDADDFMAIQKERDDYRRALALVNTWRWSPAFIDRDPRMLDRQLAAVGLTVEDARAMRSIIASVQANMEAPDARP